MTNFTKDGHQITTQEYHNTTGLVLQKIFLFLVKGVIPSSAVETIVGLPSAGTDLSVDLDTRPLSISLFMLS